ncbi:hypothetical protein [Bdellovibrio bacteriovorus]|uniref:hypothetical protein n=1 Tax=Bdellovibrio bacteriovorus TaxID=959 RepID=UPI0035A5ED8B
MRITKHLLSLILFISFEASAEGNPKADDMKFVTNFSNFACKSFRDKSEAPDQIKELGVKFTKAGVASDTRRAILDVHSVDEECVYSADFSRQKGFKVLHFEASYVSPESARCLQLKGQLDEIMKPGFKYAVKFNNYVSMLFLKELTGPCDEAGGNHLIEFAWL